MEALAKRLKVMWGLVKKMPKYEWATVTGVSPLRIRFEFAGQDMQGVPETLVANLAQGDRVKVVVVNNRATIIGRAKNDYPRRFANTTALNAWSPTDGAIAYVEADNSHYVRRSNTWVQVLEDAGWQTLSLMAGFTGSCRYRRVNGIVEIRYDINGSVTGDTQVTQALPSDFRASNEVMGVQPLPTYFDPESTRAGAVVYLSTTPGTVRATNGGAGTVTRMRGVGYWLSA